MTGDLAIGVKDALREIRFVARKEVRLLDRNSVVLRALSLNARRGQSGPGPLYCVTRRIAAPMSQTAQRLLGTPESIRLSEDWLTPLRASIGSLAEEESVSVFTAAVHKCANEALKRLGVVNAFLSEQAIHNVARAVAGRHSGADRNLALAADLTVALIAAAPVRRFEIEPEGALADGVANADDLNATCFLTLGLALAIVENGRPGESEDGDMALSSAALAVDARRERLRAALGAVNPVSALEREFAALAPYLP